MALRNKRHHDHERNLLEFVNQPSADRARQERTMPKQHNTLKDLLSRSSEITISVTGRKSGRTISNPIWFVFENSTLYLLPVKGSDTQWYKNVLENPKIRIEAAGSETELKLNPVTDAKQVAAVVDKFRAKYTPGDVRKYYSKFDVAVVAQLE